MDDDDQPVLRHVGARDANLDAAANADIAAELRDAVGADDVLVAAGTPDHRAAAHRPHSPLLAPLASMRLDLLVTAGVVSIAVGVWGVAAEGAWALVVLLLAVVAVGVVLTAVVLRMTSQTEHLAPETVAELEDQGDVDPDRAFNGLVAELARSDRRSSPPRRRVR